MKCESHYPIMGNWDVIVDHKDYTVWQCPKCGERYSNAKHKGVLEFLPDRIKEERKKHRVDLIQPYNPDGSFNGAFRDHYPEQTKDYIKDGAVSEKQVKKAKSYE